ncbi:MULTISPECIES: hypothetical protein [unclassified Lysobacter]|uniref:hypothetical protein n=1 Tax=unclassified Lysobacter TaxID=2635362 RepID=UPI001F59BA8C|nr:MULTISPECIES: hypothetical protein [unclassified Lysobacter]
MLACTSLLCATSTILACSNPPAPRAETPLAGGAPEILEISAPVYDPTGARGDGPRLEAECKRWSLTREQAGTFFRLSQPITGEQKHHEFYYLPCSIRGRLRSDGHSWDFEINAAATATWSSGNEVRTFGCSDPACEPLVLMMPEAGAD